MEIPNKIDEQAVQQKKDTLANVSALKRAAIPQTSTKVNTQVDPIAAKQHDLDTLSQQDYEFKYGQNSTVGAEYLANKFKQHRAKYAQEQRQELADSHDTVDQVVDSTLAVASGTSNLVGNTIGAGLVAASNPVETIKEGADFIATEGAKFVGKSEEFQEIKDNVNQFIEESGLTAQVATPSPELESVFGPSMSQMFLEKVGDVAETAAGYVFQGTKIASDWIKSGQSDALNAKTAIRAEENESYKAEMKESLGEDASAWEHALTNTTLGYNSFVNLLKDPAAATVTIAESIPSLIGAGKLGKAISDKQYQDAHRNEVNRITQEVKAENLSHVNTQNLINVKLQNVADDLSKVRELSTAKAAILTSGVLEGSGAAGEAYNLIVDTDFETLEKTSAKYQSLVQTMSPEEARKQLAIESAMGAGFAVFALAAGVTKVADTAPGINRASGVTKSAEGTIPRAVQISFDAGKEGIEEAFQSFISSAATGIVERENINKDKDVYADAAIAAGEGSLAGAGTSGAVSAIRLTADGLKKSSEIAKATNQKAADVQAKVKEVATSGLREADKKVDSVDAEVDTVVEGISERNQVETTSDNEKVDNIAIGFDILDKYAAQMKVVQERNKANPNEVDEKILEEGRAKYVRAQNALEEALVRNANAEELHADVEALRSGDEQASFRVLNNIATNPESVSEEAAQTLISTGSLNPEQTAQVEAHIQYIRDTKSLEEVNSDVIYGGIGFIGANQYLGNISASINAGRTEQADAAFRMLSTFAQRHAEKSRDLSEALAIAQNRQPTPAEQARLVEINNTYPSITIHKNSDSLVHKVGLEANALSSAVQTAQYNLNAEPIKETSNVQEANTETQEVAQDAGTAETETVSSDVKKQESTTEGLTEERAEVARVALSDIPTNTPEADLTGLGFVREELTTKEGKVASIAYRRDSEDGTQVENITYQDGLGGTSDTFRTFLTRKVTPPKPLNEAPRANSPLGNSVQAESDNVVEAPSEDTPLVSEQAETNTVEAPVVQTVEPVQVEESNVIEDIVGTEETLTDTTTDYEASTPAIRLAAYKQENLVKKYFRPKNKAGVIGNPLLSVANFMDKFSSNFAGYIVRYTDTKQPSAKQLELATHLESYHQNFAETVNNTFKHNPKAYGTRDMSQFMVDENGQIQPNVVAAMSIASYNWLATRAAETLFNDEDAIRDILGLQPSDTITPQMYEHLRTGGFRNFTAGELGANIVKSLGIQTVANAPGNVKTQLEMALGSLAIATMANQKVIFEEAIPSHEVFEDVTNEKITIGKITVASVQGEEFAEVAPAIAYIQETVKDTDQLLSKMFSVQDEAKGPLKEANKSVPKKVRGTNQDIPKKYQDIIRKHQARKHFLKRDQVEVFNALPLATQRDILGYKNDIDSLHARNRAAAEGINRAINASINHMADFLVENNNDEPFYFNHDVIKNGRLLMDSTTFNPQGNKLHRHMMKIEGQETVINLKEGSQKEVNDFYVAFGQGMGIDVDKQTHAVSVEEVTAMLSEPVVQEAIKAINEKDGEYTEAQLEAVLAGVKRGGEKAWSLDALVGMARYQQAIADGSDSFTHDLMVEADGITNGPGIGTLQFGIGSTAEDKTERLRKVGINTAGNTEDYASWISKAGNRDNYETITTVLNGFVQEMEGNEKVIADFTTFLLNDLVTTDNDTGEITKINRNISKGALMTTIYGAGPASIKAALGKQTIDAIYDVLESGVEMDIKALDAQLRNTFGVKLDLSNPLETTLDSIVEAGIADAVGQVVGQAMLNAMEQEYGAFKAGTAIINESMERVAETFQQMYAHSVERRTTELVNQGILAANAKGEAFETLSQNELDVILNELIESQPIMQSVLSAKNGNATKEGLYVGKISTVINNTTAYHTRQDYQDESTVNMQGRTKEYISGGASPVVLAVQNIDATTMLEHLGDRASFNVYDAIITGTSKVEEHTKNINKHFFEINRDHSIANEANKAFQRAENAAIQYDAKYGTNFQAEFSKNTERGFGDDVQIVNVKNELQGTTTATDVARLDTIGLITSSGQYGWENSSYVVDNSAFRPLGSSDTSAEATPGDTESVAQREINQYSVLDVFDEVGKLGNVKESKEHSAFLRNSLNTLKSQILNPVKLHISNVLGDTMANVEGDDIWMYTQMFGGQKGSTAILNSGLRMSTQEAMAHEMWHTVSRQGVEVNSRAQKELERRWNQAKKVVTPEMLMDNPSLDKNTEEYAQAKHAWDYIFTARVDKTEVEVDPVSGQKVTKTYSNHLHEFAAYSMTNAKFISALKQVPTDTKTRKEVRTESSGNKVIDFFGSVYDKVIEIIGDLIDTLTTHLTNTAKTPTDLAVRELVKQLSNIEAQNKNVILNVVDVAEKAQGKLADVTQATVKRIAKPIASLATSSPVRNAKYALLRLPATVVDLAKQSEHIGAVFNKMAETKRNLKAEKEGFAEQLWTEAQGLTEKFKDFHSLSRLKTKMIDVAVVAASDNTTKILEEVVGELTEAQSTAITKAMLKTDLSSLNLDNAQLTELLDNPTRIDSLIATIEAKFAGDINANYYVLQSKALGHYMATGRVTSANLNFNAKQIARLFGTGRTNFNAAQVETLIDKLTTLYALKDTNSQHKIALSEMVKTNPKGISYLLGFHTQQKKTDLEAIFAGSEVNVAKGHVSETYDPNLEMKILSEREGELYEKRGWVKSQNALPKDPADPTALPLYTYTNRHGGTTDTITGIISLISRKARGTDTVTIRQKFGDAAPVYGGAQDAAVIHAQKSKIFAASLAGASTFNPSKATQHMAPLYNLAGDITGYRYLMTDVTKDNLMGRNNDVIKAMAKQAASTINKVNSSELNRRAIEAMKSQFDKVPDSNYVQFGPGSTDKEIQELYRLLPADAKSDIQRVWGTNTMYVDKQILTMMFGYRKFSVADELAQEKAEQQFAIRHLGSLLSILTAGYLSPEQAARITGQAWSEFVKGAKDFIIIKSGIVTMGNTISNGVQLLTEGVGLLNSLKLQKEAVIELHKYRKDTAALFEVEKALELGIGQDAVNRAKIAELQASITRNPVTDVVNDGLLQSIVEDVSMVNDEYSYVGRIQNKLDKTIYRHIPGWIKAVGREVLQTKESVLYKKMSQSAQLSDFTARYALYKHKLKGGLSRQDAANNAISTFVNYDLPTHKLIQYGNDLGFLWFTKYYVRIQKILLKTLVNQPARVMSLLTFEWMFGDIVSDVYDTVAAPDTLINRVGLPKNPIDIYMQDSALSKIL
jgi:hypothetical protein